MIIFLCTNRDCRSHKIKPRQRLYFEVHDYCGYCGSKAPEFSIYGNSKLDLDSNRFQSTGSYSDEQYEKRRNDDYNKFTLDDISPSKIEYQIDRLTEDTGFLLQNSPTSWGNQSSNSFPSEEINTQFAEGTSISAIEIQRADAEVEEKLPASANPLRANMKFCYVGKGQFFMGSSNQEKNWALEEQPKHGVSVERFWMSNHPITESQYWNIMGRGKEVKSNYPITGVSFWNAMRFCELFSIKNGRDYRLPTEAEWEYACRGDTTSLYNTGNELTEELAHYNKNATSIVGEYPPNAFGLYDMHGNVWEWCLDTWHENYDGHPKNGIAWISNEINSEPRIIRGGSYSNEAKDCRSASRSKLPPNTKTSNVGFRIVCERRSKKQK